MNGKFLYVVSQQLQQPQFGSCPGLLVQLILGELTQVQIRAQPNEQNFLSSTADGNSLYLTNVRGGTQSTTVYNRYAILDSSRKRPSTK